MSFKEKVRVAALALLDGKIKLFEKTIQELADSAGSDSKSSAGDKHETARAMMQLEQEKISKQLVEVQEQKKMLLQTPVDTLSTHIAKGSLVKTAKGVFLLSVGFGKINVEGSDVIGLSPQSPLGQKLMGLKEGEQAAVNGIIYSIEKIS